MKSFLSYLFYIFLSCWIVGFVIFCLYTVSLQYTIKKNADAVVVMTGSGERIYPALALLKEKKAKRLFISGVNKKVSKDTLFGDESAEILDKISLGYDAETTYQNAAEIQEWVSRYGVKTIFLVSSFYHLPRGILELEYKVPSLDIVPYPIFSVKKVKKNYLQQAWLLLIEYHKFVCVWLRLKLEN